MFLTMHPQTYGCRPVALSVHRILRAAERKPLAMEEKFELIDAEWSDSGVTITATLRLRRGRKGEFEVRLSPRCPRCKSVAFIEVGHTIRCTNPASPSTGMGAVCWTDSVEEPALSSCVVEHPKRGGYVHYAEARSQVDLLVQRVGDLVFNRDRDRCDPEASRRRHRKHDGANPLV